MQLCVTLVTDLASFVFCPVSDVHELDETCQVLAVKRRCCLGLNGGIAFRLVPVAREHLRGVRYYQSQIVRHLGVAATQDDGKGLCKVGRLLVR